MDLQRFQINETLEEDKVLHEILHGDGFTIIRGLFDADEINHARDLILYLIGRQGSKATHFQVHKVDCNC